MRRLIVMCIAVALSVYGAAAQKTATEWLNGLNSSLGTRYAMLMSVSMSDIEEPMRGYLMVDGDSYYLTLGVMEVYSDGRVRYEINNDRKEVTEDRVNLDSVDILSNPTRAFSFIADEYNIMVDASSGETSLTLTPKSDNLGVSDIVIGLAEDGGKILPKRLTYNYDGDVVIIALTMADTSTSKLPRWSKDEYRAYDMVSFL